MLCEMELQRTETTDKKEDKVTNTKCTRIYVYESKPEKSNEWSGIAKDINNGRLTAQKMILSKTKETSCSFNVTKERPGRNCYKGPFAAIYDMVCYSFIYLFIHFLKGNYLLFNSLSF